MGIGDYFRKVPRYETDPEFYSAFLASLITRLGEKKFGVKVWNEHRELALRKPFENEAGIVTPPETNTELEAGIEKADALIPEIGVFVRACGDAKNLEALKAVAKSYRLEITEKDIQEATRDAEELNKLDKKLTE